jgi:signal transduction histidine kinase
LGRFAAGIAHEINNPLEGMANYLHLLDADLHDGSVDEARRWLPRLREGIDRAAGTVRQVLSFAEPGQGAKLSTDLGDIAERTLHFLRRHPDCVHIRLHRHNSDTVEVLGDPQTLGQLVLNLVLNACQAQERDGEVEVRVAAVDPDRAELVIEDRGPGFPEAIRQHLFEPFQSGRGSLGLGLAVCLGIVVDHGGEISVADRDDGPGSRVRVLLPLADHASNPKGHR